MATNSGEHGHYNELRQSEREGVRPGFLGGEGGGEKPEGLESDTGSRTRADSSRIARDDLSSMEEASSKEGLYHPDAGVNEAKETEEAAGGFFSGDGRKEASLKKGRFNGRFKKGAPIVAIFGMIVGFGAFMIGGQSFQLFAWVANTNLNFGQSSAVLNLRTNFVMGQMLRSDPYHSDIVKGTIFGGEKYKISSSMEAKLKTNHIDVVDTEGTDGKALKMLVWNNPEDGTRIPIVVSDNDVGRVPSSYGDAEVPLAKGITLDAAKKTLSGFNTDLDTATINLTGKAAGWFDSLADAFFKRIGGDDARNKLSKLTNESDTEDIDEVMYKNASDGSDDSSVSQLRKAEQDEDGTVVDENGKPVIESDTLTNSDFSDGDDGGNNALKVGDTDTNKIESKLNTTIKKAGVGASVACIVLRGIGAINTVVAGTQVSNVVDYTLKILEASDKVRAGAGNDSFNKIANSINESIESTAYDANGDPVSITGSIAGSNGWNNAFSSTNLVSENEPGALMVNREYATRTALRRTDYSQITDWADIVGELGSSRAVYSVCNGIQLALGAADLLGDIVLFFSTAGIGNALKEFFGGVLEGIKVGFAIGALSAVVSALAPMVGQWLAGNLKDIFIGKIGGYVLDSGAHIIHDGNLQMSAGMNANKEQTLELYAMTREVEKEWAAYDRATLSPFDVTSKYTFLGSLAYSIIPLINSSRTSVISVATSSIGLLGDSVATLSGPSVSALNSARVFKLSLSSDENCTNLTSMGLAGDAYCNKYSGAYIDDLATKTSQEFYENLAKRGNFDGVDEYGNPRIKVDSDYAKYIIACNTNDVQPGTMSAVVQGFISKKSNAFMNTLGGGTVLGNTLVGIGSGFIPFEGAIDVMAAVEEEGNADWNSQKVCSDPAYRDYSDYSVDQRVLEGLGVIKESAVASFLNEYYEENPIDNSYEGKIARYSGLSKKEVGDTLALIDYINYVANYDASERYAFGAPRVEEGKEVKFDNEYELSSVPVLLGQVEYADVRNRNYVV